MKIRTEKSVRRARRTNSAICCCHGTVYASARNMLSVVVDTACGIVDRLVEIDGVVVVALRGQWCELECPPLRLLEITHILVPLDSVRARAAMSSPACHRVVMRNPITRNVFRELGG